MHLRIGRGEHKVWCVVWRERRNACREKVKRDRKGKEGEKRGRREKRKEREEEGEEGKERKGEGEEGEEGQDPQGVMCCVRAHLWVARASMAREGSLTRSQHAR